MARQHTQVGRTEQASRALSPVKVKTYIKTKLRQAKGLYVGAFHAFSGPDLERALRDCGIAAGDVVFVHSSYDAFQGFSGKPSDVIALLQAAVGGSGTLVMPTLPFNGSAVEYASANPVFDVKRTPSRMGLLTELFRRSPGVVRSIHPTHSVAAWGANAAALTEGHHLTATPCGAGSPYARLLDARGKILLLGTDIDVLTIFHTVEEYLETKIPFSPFTTEVFVLQSRDHSGNIVTTRTRLFEPAVSRRRNVFKLVPHLKRDGGWGESRAGRLSVIVLDAAGVLAAAAAMANRGEYCYD